MLDGGGEDEYYDSQPNGQHQHNHQVSTTKSKSSSNVGVGISNMGIPRVSSSGRVIMSTESHYERQYACKQCQFFTNNPRAALYHRKEVHHEKINVHECQYCQYASQYSGKVERHTMLRHKIDMTTGAPLTNSNGNGAAAGFNSKEVDDEEDLDPAVGGGGSDVTMSGGGGGGGKFQCNKCPCKYKRSSDLSKHLRLKHNLNSNHLNVYAECVELNTRNG